jgi:hypothetical protein
MHSRDAYQTWLVKSRSVQLSDGFAQGVMKQISRDAEQRQAAMPDRELFQRWLEWVAHHPLVQTALLVGALIAGAARLLATWQIILSL